MALKDSEYGGADTRKMQGIQPSPHQVTSSETLRLMYATDPAEVTSAPDALAPKVTPPNDPTPPPLVEVL